MGRPAARVLQEVPHLLPGAQRVVPPADLSAGLGHWRRSGLRGVRCGAVWTRHAGGTVHADDRGHVDACATLAAERISRQGAVTMASCMHPSLHGAISSSDTCRARRRTSTATRPRVSRWRCGITTRALCSAAKSRSTAAPASSTGPIMMRRDTSRRHRAWCAAETSNTRRPRPRPHTRPAWLAREACAPRAHVTACMWQWGSAEHGLEPPPLVSGMTIRAVSVTNSTYGHHGEMALPEVSLVQI